MTKEEIKEQIAECEEKLRAEQERLADLRKELDKPEYSGKRWKPKLGDRYWRITGYTIYSMNWNNDREDNNNFVIGNVFPSKEAAEFEAERRKVIVELSEFAEGDEAVWDTYAIHWLIGYSFIMKRISYEYIYSWKTNQLYFPSKEAAEAAVNAVGEERVKKYYFGIK